MNKSKLVLETDVLFATNFSIKRENFYMHFCNDGGVYIDNIPYHITYKLSVKHFYIMTQNIDTSRSFEDKTNRDFIKDTKKLLDLSRKIDCLVDERKNAEK